MGTGTTGSSVPDRKNRWKTYTMPTPSKKANKLGTGPFPLPPRRHKTGMLNNDGAVDGTEMSANRKRVYVV